VLLRIGRLGPRGLEVVSLPLPTDRTICDGCCGSGDRAHDANMGIDLSAPYHSEGAVLQFGKTVFRPPRDSHPNGLLVGYRPGQLRPELHHVVPS
jgi:hypothetical protein